MLRVARGAVHMLLLQVICTDLIGDEWYCQHTENPSIISKCCGTVEPLRSQHKLECAQFENVMITSHATALWDT